MKRLLIILIAVMLFISCGISVSASEVNNTEDVTENTDNVYESNEPSQENTNPFAEIYGYACEHADNIFSVLAFIGSIVLAFVYKKGLMPALSSALGNLRTSVKSISDTAEKTLVGSENAYTDFKSNMELISKGLDTLCISVAELDNRLSASEKAADESEKMKTIMSAQVDMLYNIFMSSSLPQYSKDAVGERISEMKAALAEPVSNDD